MELFEKYTWIIPITTTISLWFVSFLSQNHIVITPIILLGILLCSMFSFPHVMRSIICLTWEAAPAMVVSHNDLSRFYVNEAGAISFNIIFELDLEYVAGNRLFKGKILKHDDTELTFLEIVYFNPRNPKIYTYRKGMTWLSIWLLIDIFWLLLFGYILSIYS